MLYTTLNEIESRDPRKDGWEKLLSGLNKTEADDETLSLMKILELSGIEGAMWYLRCFDYKDYCLFNADVAESVLHLYEEKYPKNTRIRNCIQGIRDYHANEISLDQLKTLRSAASSAFDVAYASAAYAAYAPSDASAFAAASSASSAASAASAFAAANADADAACAAAYAANDAAAANAYSTASAAASYFYTSVYASAAAADARKQKWQEIEQIFIKNFGE